MGRKCGIRVLVVDDEFEMAALLADVLDDRGFSALALQSGKEAFERLQRESFDAVVTDLRMPGFDGLRLVRKSRELDPTRPVIVMTGHGAIDSALEASRQGAYHYLMKHLVNLIEQALADTHAVRRPVG